MGSTGSKSTEQEEVDFKLHVAIDFGTDGCGLAFVYKNEVKIYDKWRTGKRKRTTKTKTQILLNTKYEVCAFGNGAKLAYSNLCGAEPKSLLFFERFKMSLYENNLRQPLVDELDEKEMPSIEIVDTLCAMNGKLVNSEIVFVGAFKFLQQLVKEYMPKNITKEKINDNEIQWILTVPAIWSESAKDKMKKWIIKAGLVNESIKDQCVIVYEPDCASLSIQKEYELECKLHDEDDNKIAFNHPGDKYILIDAGGGTVDIACHKILGTESVEEVVYPTGGKWGSCYIDDDYIKLLGEIFSKEWIKEYNQIEPSGYVEVMDSFQTAKTTFYNNSEAVTHRIYLPFEFLQFLEEKLNETQPNTTVTDKINKFSKPIKFFCELFGPNSMDKTDDLSLCLLHHATKKNTYDSDNNEEYLEMDVKIWKCMFNSKIDPIISHIHELLNKESLKNGCKYLGLVGGFSSSLYFQEKMEQQFGMESKYKLKLLIPKHPILSVVNGAAYMGITKNYIKKRKLPFTYGINVYYEKTYAKTHGIQDEYIENNTINDEMVKNCFHIIARKNESIGINSVKMHKVQRISNQKKAIVQILCSDKYNPKIVSDGIAIGSLEVACNQLHDEIMTEFHFHGTIIKVYVYPKSVPDQKHCVDIEYRN